jgi:hypothetical protein
MPLAFASRTHGTIAFGFFNIEIDLLLLDRLFFFAGDFSMVLTDLLSAPRTALAGWRLLDPALMGDLHGAIAGEDLGGLIGATYARWPFPRAPEDFRQNPEGTRNRIEVEDLVDGFAGRERIACARDDAFSSFSIGEYGFNKPRIAALVTYVERGGYPRWKDDVQPVYVRQMMASLKGSPILG